MDLILTGFYTLHRGENQLELSSDGSAVTDEIRFTVLKNNGTEDITEGLTINPMYPIFDGSCGQSGFTAPCGTFAYLIQDIPDGIEVEVFFKIYVDQYGEEYSIQTGGLYEASYTPINSHLKFDTVAGTQGVYQLALDLDIPDNPPTIQGISFTDSSTNLDIIGNQLDGYVDSDSVYMNWESPNTYTGKLFIKNGQTVCMKIHSEEDFGLLSSGGYTWQTSGNYSITTEENGQVGCVTFSQAIGSDSINLLLLMI